MGRAKLEAVTRRTLVVTMQLALRKAPALVMVATIFAVASVFHRPAPPAAVRRVMPV